MKQNFYINKFEGQLGNQLLAYNNLCQLSYPDGNVSITENSEIPKYFKNINTFSGKKKGLEINANSVRKGVKYQNRENIVLRSPFLGELFFFSTKEDPRKFLQIKDEYLFRFNNDKTNIAIHLRMLDLMKNYDTWKKNNPYKAIKHEYFNDFEYIKSSIEICLQKYSNCNFVVFGASSLEHFTDQEDIENHRTMDKFPLYLKVTSYLKDNDITWEHSITMKDKNKSYFYDFSQMTECDIIIANPSTFSTCATFLGKKGKKVIYKKSFLDIASKNALFWTDLKKGGNDFYKIDILI